jgi:chromosome segregation ATPase
MLTGKRRVNKNKLLKNNSLEEKKIIIDNYNLSIAKLKIEEEKMIRKNNDLSEAITKKNSEISGYKKDKEKIKKANYEEASNLRLKLKELKGLIDFNSNYLKTLEAMIPDKKKQEKELIESIGKLIETKKILEDEIVEKAEKGNKTQTEANDNLAKTLKALSGAQNQLIAFREEIELAKKELEGIKETCVLENKILSRRQQDLDIYEKRLKRKYPEEIINL